MSEHNNRGDQGHELADHAEPLDRADLHSGVLRGGVVMGVFRPIAWHYLADLGVSLRWVRGDAFLDVLSGNWRDNRDLPLIKRMVTTRSTWVDNRDVFAEFNRAVGARWPEWHRTHGLIRAEVGPPPVTSRQPRGPVSRSTDFVVKPS